MGYEKQWDTDETAVSYRLHTIIWKKDNQRERKRLCIDDRLIMYSRSIYD